MKFSAKFSIIKPKRRLTQKVSKVVIIQNTTHSDIILKFKLQERIELLCSFIFRKKRDKQIQAALNFLIDFEMFQGTKSRKLKKHQSACAIATKTFYRY